MALIPTDIQSRYEVHEWRNASAVLKGAHPHEWKEILDILRQFRLRRSEVLAKGGRKSPVAVSLDQPFYDKGWKEQHFRTAITVDEAVYESPTHKVDCFKNKVGVEVEWNNKDPFFDRDLNNFRLLFELRAVDVGVIITRADELNDSFDKLGASTTHMGKLLPRLEGGGGGGCPILAFGIGLAVYDPEH